MKKYQLILSHSDILDAKDRQDAINRYFKIIEDETEDILLLPILENFITKNLKIDEALLASELSEEAQEKVLEKFGDINVNDIQWANRDEAPFLDIESFGIEINPEQMSWQLDYPYRQLYFDTPHDGSGSSQLGIVIANIDKLVKKLKRDLNLSEKIARAMRNGEIELYFSTRHFGGGDGKTYFNFEDNTKKNVTGESAELDEALQEWFEDNIVNYLLKSLQEEYDYLTSKEAVIETLDINEYLFAEDGSQL